MWKKGLAFAAVLGLIVLLDPTPTPAQPGGGGGGGKGGKGGYGRPDGGGAYAPPGGAYTLPVTGTPGAYPAPGSPGAYPAMPGGYNRRDGGNPGGYTGAQPGTNPYPGERPAYGAFPGGGPGGGGDRPAFGGPGGGPGGPGGGPGGPGRGPGGGGGGGRDPEFGWRMLQGLTGGTDTVDLSKIPAERRQFLDGMSQRFGTRPYPTSGVWTKDQYLEFNAANEALRQANQANGGGPGGPGGGPGGPGGFDRNRGMGDPNGYGMGGYGMGGYGMGGYGMGEFRPPFEKKETEEERPVAMRYGKLPQGLPGWFDELDTDKDGQVSLYEWRKGSKDMKEFLEMDLNSDGLVTADEYLRFARQKGIDTKVEAYIASDGAERPTNWGLGAPIDKGDAKGGPNGKWGGKGGDNKGGDRKDGGDNKGGDRKDGGKDGGGKGGDRPRGEGNPWFKPKN